MTLQNPITEPQVPAAIARDTEFQAADAAHVGAGDPHPQYLSQAKFLTSDFFFQVSAPNLVGGTWQEIGPPLVLGEQGKPTVWLVTFYFQYPNGNSLIDYWQYCGSAILGAVFWKATARSEGTATIQIETHTEYNYVLKIRGGLGQARSLEVNPDRNINIAAPGFMRVYFKKLL